jgi:hypothetical protein
MMIRRRLDDHRLEKLCGVESPHRSPDQAIEIVLELGPGLSRWLLHPEVLAAAAQVESCPAGSIHRAPPELGSQPGLCWVLFAVKRPEAYPALRPVFVLPLCWAPGQPDSARLPRPLHALAAAVRAGLGLHSWGLQPAFGPEQAGTDLSRLTEATITCASGFASLAGGLMVAAAGGKPDPTVWATGVWEPGRGIRPVGHLAAKLAAARALGARVVFVPASQEPEARLLARDGLEIAALAEGEVDLEKALTEYRLRLDAPPARTDPFGPRRAWYTRQHDDEVTVQDYYQTHLLPDLIAHYRGALERSRPGWRPDHLVTTVSAGARELVPLQVGVLRPRVLWLVYTPGDDRFRARLDELKRRLAELGRGSDPDTACAIRDVAIGGRDEPLLRPPKLLRPDWREAGSWSFDLTLGNKPITLALSSLAREDDVLCYWSHELHARRAVPGTQALFLRGPETAWSPAAGPLCPWEPDGPDP